MVVTRARNLSDRTLSAPITGNGNALVSTVGCGVVTWSVSGSWTGSLVFEASVDGSTGWLQLAAIPILPRSGTEAGSTTVNGQWLFACGSVGAVRVRGVSVTGTANIFFDASAATPGVQPTSLVYGPNVAIVNADGSLDVNVVQSVSVPSLNYLYNEVLGVASGIETTIVTVNGTLTPMKVQKIDVSGENIAFYRVKINGTAIFAKRTYWGSLNEIFTFEDFQNGLNIGVGQLLTVTVIHNRPSAANFEATVLSR